MAAVTDAKENFALFELMATAAGAEVYRAHGLAAAKDRLVTLLKLLRPGKIVACEGGLLEKLALPAAAEQIGAALFTDRLRLHAPAADLGVSEMDLGIAETGSIAQDATDVKKRLVSTLPPVHLALLRAQAIVPTFREAILKAAEKNGPPPYWTVITGPSRTADIERVLTVGVHGPYRLLIVVVGEESEI